MAKIVIIDDEASILQLMTKVAEGLGLETFSFQSGAEGMQKIEEIEPDVLIVDLMIGDMNGLDIIKRCGADYPNMDVIMVTGYGTVETAVEAMKLGAFDYLTKPFELDDLKRTINRSLSQSGHSPSPSTLSTEAAAELSTYTSTLIGESPQITHILDFVKKIADNDSPVLIEGEFGSGKQMFARAIHNQSRRNESPFKVLHCSSLPEDLLELELFGGGSGSSSTIFQRAQGGTVLLEEVHVMPLRLQSQLDAFLENINEQRLRGSLPPHLDTRVIASSNESLEKWVKEGKFREDLYYRISVIPINVPPLRNRNDDIPLLIDHFLENYSKLSGSNKKDVDKYALELLTNYKWPGNVGELQNAIERACALAEHDKIRPVDLPNKITQKVEVTDEENEQLRHQLPIGTSLSDYIKKQERVFIRETLKYNEGNREKTASMLGVSIATLYRKMGLKLERDKKLLGA
ncbi:MAG: sigma-54 dependent transcriptional regulator [Verrucomicrobiota bacterium]